MFKYNIYQSILSDEFFTQALNDDKFKSIATNIRNFNSSNDHSLFADAFEMGILKLSKSSVCKTIDIFVFNCSCRKIDISYYETYGVCIGDVIHDVTNDEFYIVSMADYVKIKNKNVLKRIKFCVDSMVN